MTVSRTVLAFAAAAAIGAGLAGSPPVHAQSSSNRSATPPAATSGPATQAPSARSQNDNSRSDAKVEARIAQLHKELKITKDQESDWNTLAQDMRQNAQRMSSLLQERAAASKSKPMNAVDNLKSYEQITDAHAEGLKKITPDFEKLYDEMSPAQKKTADTVFNQRVNQRVRTTATPSPGNRS
jgi:hypothetical protein